MLVPSIGVPLAQRGDSCRRNSPPRCTARLVPLRRRASLGPARRLKMTWRKQAAKVPAQAAWHDIEIRLSRFNTVDGWVGPNELLLTAARR
jgi:hypothetical protein